jgi:2Fe-2S type ferredoxin
MILYTANFFNKEQNINITIKISPTESILNSAEKHGIILPFTCRTGNCSSCTCKIIKGKLKHINQTFLTDQELRKNYFLACVAYPQSNLIIKTHMENFLY